MRKSRVKGSWLTTMRPFETLILTVHWVNLVGLRSRVVPILSSVISLGMLFHYGWLLNQTRGESARLLQNMLRAFGAQAMAWIWQQRMPPFCHGWVLFVVCLVYVRQEVHAFFLLSCSTTGFSTDMRYTRMTMQQLRSEVCRLFGTSTHLYFSVGSLVHWCSSSWFMPEGEYSEN